MSEGRVLRGEGRENTAVAVEDTTRPGRSYPLGATPLPGGVQFCVFSKNCTAVELLLFDKMDDVRPARVIALDPARNRTFYYWHVLVPGIRSGQLYGYRVHGPYDPREGFYFDGTKVLLDPYARVVQYGENYSREAARRAGDNCAQAFKSVVLDPAEYDWQGDVPLQRPHAGSVIYEMHVRGFTRHPSSAVDPRKRGAYAGVIEKIPYLQELGVSAVELLPIQQFDEQLGANTALQARCDYWGYDPIGFFAPHRGYSSRQGALGPADEFRDMVKALHRAGIEVILDVVFNHTAEGDERGPTLCFRGLENRAYYIPQEGRMGYANFSGCGNSVNGNHSIVRRLIIDCLHYWVEVMHVDGFRFDLASILARDEAGQPLANPPILWEIESDPVLAGTKIIAEAWDAEGLYQVGRFIGHRWAEWNGPFRDDVRRFVRSEPGTVTTLAARLVGSPDIFAQPDRDVQRTINFITCHDGFTLHDLVSYNGKHNEANREGNRDGAPVNFSWNCGVEGPTDRPEVLALRLKQMKNLLTILLIAQGTPLLLMGDEGARTQLGNNNAYCQDNELSWLNWSVPEAYRSLRRFVQGLIRFRRSHSLYRMQSPWAGPAGSLIHWHGVRPLHPDWGHDSHSLAFSVGFPDGGETICVLLNAYWEPLRFELPAPPNNTFWHRVVDTALPEPEDFAEPGHEGAIEDRVYLAQARSVVLLEAR